MYKDYGLIIRAIPYSDSGRILHCFTEKKGVQALYLRLSKKRQVIGHLMPGSFIEFAARQKPGSSLSSLSESRWDARMPTDRLSPEQHIVWLFTLELLQKSLKEDFPLPQLLHRVRLYYALLSQQEINADPLVALVTVSGALGLSDVQMVLSMADKPVAEALEQLGWRPNALLKEDQKLQHKELFNLECDRFQQHFGIEQLESLYLFDL